MQKEILTNEIIKKDLKHRAICSTAIFFIYPILAVFSHYIFKTIFVLSGTADGIGRVVLPLIVMILILVYVYEMAVFILSFYKISKNKFEITTDWVIDKRIKTSGGRYRRQRPYTLILARCDKYEIPDIQNYKWSTLYKMTDEQTFNSFNIDDDLYLIKIDNRNLLVYNKKYFDYKDGDN